LRSSEAVGAGADCLPAIDQPVHSDATRGAEEDASASLADGARRRGRNLPDHCAEVSLGGAHTSAQLPRVDPLTRAASGRKRLGQGVGYAFRGTGQGRSRCFRSSFTSRAGLSSRTP
jgi:hypothetical protein